MFTEEPHIFATHTWRTVPFAVHPKTVIDRLVDILLSIPGCLLLYNQIDSKFSLEDQTIRLELMSAASSQLQRLDNWWQEFAESVAGQSEEYKSLQHPPKEAADSSSSRESFPQDAFIAACTALYHSVNIVLYSLLLYASFQACPYASAIRSRTGLVLSIASHLIAHGSSSAGRLMMVFPLKVVCRWALDDIARQSAVSMLKQWGEQNGIDGICTKAAPQLNRPLHH